jgi:CheY-like chemotaxis protein
MDQMFAGIQNVISKEVKDLLVVEDDDELREGIEHLLESDAIRITAVSNGREALEMLETSTYDCMILDLRLPDMSGFDILRVMAGMNGNPTPPVIIYTGKELTKEEQLELNKYADSVVLKGVKSDERLVDETTLFLHTVVEKMGQKVKSKLSEIYDNDSFMKNKKVVVVDDDVRNVFALTDELEELNMIVVKATNGQEALEVLEENPDADIVLMDIMMPVMDGYEAIRRIRQHDRFRDIPILALTAKAMRGDRDKCIKAGATDYIPKPIDFDRLMSTMRVWLKK